MFTEKSRLQIRTGDNPEIWTDVSSYSNGTPLPVNIFNNLVTQAYDYISISYTGDNITGVVFKTGGSGGTTVATLALTYDVDDRLLTVTKS
jgi:hypothetical protein